MNASNSRSNFEMGIALDKINLFKHWMAIVLNFAFLVEHDSRKGVMKSGFIDNSFKKVASFDLPSKVFKIVKDLSEA